MMKSNSSKQLKSYHQLINFLGYRSCKKYLGVNSIFNKFTPTEKTFRLPIFKAEEEPK